MKDLIKVINRAPHGDGLLLFDEVNSVYCHTGITACGAIGLDVTP